MYYRNLRHEIMNSCKSVVMLEFFVRLLKDYLFGNYHNTLKESLAKASFTFCLQRNGLIYYLLHYSVQSDVMACQEL